MSPNTNTPNFVSTRKDAWHQLGPVLPGAATAEEALKLGRLAGWNIRKTPMLAQVGAQLVPVPGQCAMVRDNPWTDNQVDVLAAVAGSYQVLQNEDYTSLLNMLAEDSGATFETAGELDGGRQAFITLKLPGVAKVGGADVVETYVAVLMSHDSNTSTRIMVTPVRVAGQATLNLAFLGADHSFKVRHTVGAHKAIAQQAKDAMEFTYNYVDGFQEQAARLADTKLTQARFEQLITKAFGAPKGAAAPTVTRTQNKLDHMAELFSDTFALDGIRGTAWAGLAALAEWSDHHSPVRGAGLVSDADARGRKALMDPAFKNQALKLMLQVAA